MLDGAEASAKIFTPGFVGLVVPRGRHEVTFEYAPFPRYDLPLGLGALAFAALWVIQRRR